MIKIALCSPAALLLAVACHVANAEAPQQTILQCTGEQSSEGINAPKNVTVPKRDPNVGGTYSLQGNVLIESGGGTFADERYDLCSTTSTNYVYSTDCSVDRLHYISDWLEVADVPAHDRFIAKHKASAYTLDTVVIDRVNLSVNSEYLSNHTGMEYDKKNTKMVLTPYLLSIRFLGNCGVAKAKL